MARRTAHILVIAVVTLALSLGLSGCRKETKVTPTPAVSTPQVMPTVEPGASPLPTPGVDTSPVQK